MPTVDRDSRNPRSGLRFRSPRKALSEVPGVRRPMTARAPVPDAIRASPDQVSAFRLSRHHLVKRAPASALAQVAGDMAGVQAQLLSAAQISFWARTPGLSVDHVENALWRDRILVKSWCIRGALPIIPPKDFALFLRGGAPRNTRSLAWPVPAPSSVDPGGPPVQRKRGGARRPLPPSAIA